MERWEAFIADYEAKIDSAEHALDTGEPLDRAILQPFEAPEGLGPLPVELRDRALEILRKNEQLERRLHNALGVLGRELGNATRATAGARTLSPFAETVVPKYLDQRG